MPLILHKFRDHIVAPSTQILILGTFNPDIPNGPAFFYGRSRNYLWRLLPGCFGAPSLKENPLAIKQAFMANHNIDFVDIIHEVNVPEGEENNVDDTFIDALITEWKDIVDLIDNLPNLRAVYFTRKTFAGIPNIEARVAEIKEHCIGQDIRFCFLMTPARFCNEVKQQQWIDTIVNQHECLQ